MCQKSTVRLDRTKESGGHYASLLGVGAQRAATTWLHHSLRRHPDLWLPPAKELHHFDWMATGPSLIDRLTSENRIAMLWRKRGRNAAERLLAASPRSADLALPLADDLDPGSPLTSGALA
jgi:hypothetical protein